MNIGKEIEVHEIHPEPIPQAIPVEKEVVPNETTPVEVPSEPEKVEVGK